MPIKVIINGASGKMGIVSAQLLEENSDFEVVAKLHRGDNLKDAISHTKAQIVVDFTSAEVVFDNINTIIDAKVHPVIGSSGLTASQIKSLQKKSKQEQLGGIIAPNFSIGAILMMKYAEDAAHYLSDVEIIETHHNNKLDLPSGTAINTAERISNNITASPRKNTKETIPGAQGALYNNIPIHSIRLPGYVANQRVIFGSNGETLSIEHNSINRECFMPGVLLACRKVIGLKELIYGLEHIL